MTKAATRGLFDQCPADIAVAAPITSVLPALGTSPAAWKIPERPRDRQLLRVGALGLGRAGVAGLEVDKEVRPPTYHEVEQARQYHHPAAHPGLEGLFGDGLPGPRDRREHLSKRERGRGIRQPLRAIEVVQPAPVRRERGVLLDQPRPGSLHDGPNVDPRSAATSSWMARCISVPVAV